MTGYLAPVITFGMLKDITLQMEKPPGSCLILFVTDISFRIKYEPVCQSSTYLEPCSWYTRAPLFRMIP